MKKDDLKIIRNHDLIKTSVNRVKPSAVDLSSTSLRGKSAVEIQRAVENARRVAQRSHEGGRRAFVVIERHGEVVKSVRERETANEELSAPAAERSAEEIMKEIVDEKLCNFRRKLTGLNGKDDHALILVKSDQVRLVVKKRDK